VLLLCELCSVVVPIVTIAAINGINQSEVNATHNKMFNVTCKVESYPPVVVYWEVNGKQVGNNSVVIVDTNECGATCFYN